MELGSIPHGADPMVEWFSIFPELPDVEKRVDK